MKQHFNREKLEFLNKKLKKRKYISILLALFTLGVNIFAWFAFSANAGLALDGTVASWDVEFKDNDVVTRDIVIEVTQMKPGMDDFSKTIEVESKSDVLSKFSYEIVSFSILGIPVDVSTRSDMEDYIKTFYPFSISMLASKTTLSQEDTITFDVGVTWPFESATPLYFGQDEVYSFNDTFPYYKLEEGSYVNANITNSTLYTSQKNSLFLEKDDADTFFGMQCKQYETSTDSPCLTMTVRLLVEQVME